MSSPVDWEDDLQTELCHEDDGFVYRRKRRRRSDDEPSSGSTSASASTQADLEKERMLWRRNKLFRLRDEYRKEIRYWEFLTDSLRKIEERPVSVGDESVELSDGAVLAESVEPGSGSDVVRVVDELLVKAEAQEATISHVSNLCDVAELVCSELEEQQSKLFVDLSVWESSPRKLMAFLCD